MKDQLKRVLSLNNLFFLVLSGLMMLAIVAEVVYALILLADSFFSNAIQTIQDFPQQLDPVAIVQYAANSLPILISAIFNSLPLKWNGLLLWLLGIGIYAGSVLVWGIGVFRTIVSRRSPISRQAGVIAWVLLFIGIGIHFGSLIK